MGGDAVSEESEHEKAVREVTSKMAKEMTEEIDNDILNLILDVQVAEVGQVRMTVEEPRMVRLVNKKGCAPLGQSGVWWNVEDVRYGYEFLCAEKNFSPDTYNAMEVIAWTAAQ